MITHLQNDNWQDALVSLDRATAPMRNQIKLNSMTPASYSFTCLITCNVGTF